MVKAQTWLEISKHYIPFKPLSSNTLHDDEMTTMVMNVNDVDDDNEDRASNLPNMDCEGDVFYMMI